MLSQGVQLDSRLQTGGNRSLRSSSLESKGRVDVGPVRQELIDGGEPAPDGCYWHVVFLTLLGTGLIALGEAFIALGEAFIALGVAFIALVTLFRALVVGL